MESYAKGITNGDKNLYFVDGKDIYGENPEEYSYDGCHPNDAGYLKMAQAFAKVIKNIRNKKPGIMKSAEIIRSFI